jgi:predicted RNase H-like HicB family nuclease
MTEYLAIYERNSDGWWAYVPDLPGCTAAGDDREEIERNAWAAVAAQVELLRATVGRYPSRRRTTSAGSRSDLDRHGAGGEPDP